MPQDTGDILLQHWDPSTDGQMAVEDKTSQDNFLTFRLGISVV